MCYVYSHTYIHVTAINEQRGHEFEREKGGGIWETLKEGKGRG